MVREDEFILNQYKMIVDMIGLFFKDSVEVVLHSLDNLENSVVYIHNGQKTCRTIGSPVTDKALKILAEFEDTNKRLFGPYKTVSHDGHVMKSVTTVIVNPQGRAIGMLCMNFDLDTPLSSMFKFMFEDFAQSSDGSNSDNEYFATDIHDLLSTSVNQIKHDIQDNDAIPLRQKNKAIIMELQKQGLFNLRNSVPIISEILNLSKDAIYLHLRSMKKQGIKVQSHMLND